MPMTLPFRDSRFLEIGKLIGANFNTTADQAIPIILPAGFTKYRINSIQVINPSASLSTAAGGVYPAASKAGTAIVAASQTYAALTSATPGAAGSLLTMTIANSTTIILDYLTLYFALTTAQGSPATGDIRLFGILSP